LLLTWKRFAAVVAVVAAVVAVAVVVAAAVGFQAAECKVGAVETSPAKGRPVEAGFHQGPQCRVYPAREPAGRRGFLKEPALAKPVRP
jgi:hypothetical protein